MSRRILFRVLAASAALIATQAAADPECFGESCRLLETGESAVVSPLDAGEAAAPEAHAAAPETGVAAPKPSPAKALPQMAADPVVRAPAPPVPTLVVETKPPREPVRPAPAKILARTAAAPEVRVPVPPVQTLAAETSTTREPARLTPRYLKDAPPAPAPVTDARPVDYARSARVLSPDTAHVLGYNAAAVGGIFVVVPGTVYATGRYMIAPSAKIISIDPED